MRQKQSAQAFEWTWLRTFVAGLVVCAMLPSTAGASSMTSVCGGVTRLLIDGIQVNTDCIGYRRPDVVISPESPSRARKAGRPATPPSEDYLALAQDAFSSAPSVVFLDKGTGFEQQVFLDEVWAPSSAYQSRPRANSARSEAFVGLGLLRPVAALELSRYVSERSAQASDHSADYSAHGRRGGSRGRSLAGRIVF